MQTHIGWLWIVGFFGLLAAANAQTALRPAANTQFDGTYAFVSSTKVNETSRDFKNRELQCPDRSAGALTILNGAARYMGLRRPGVRRNRRLQRRTGDALVCAWY